MKKITSLMVLFLFCTGIVFSQEGKQKKYVKFDKGSSYSLQNAKQLIRKNLNLSSDDELIKVKTEKDQLGFTHEKYEQYFQGVKVEFGTYTVHAKNGSLKSMNGELFSAGKLNLSPSLSKQTAFNKAVLHVGAQKYMWQNSQEAKLMNYNKPQGELVVLPAIKGVTNASKLAYKFDVYAKAPLYRADVYVDAHTGKILFENKKIHHADTPATGTSLYNGTVSFTADSFNGAFRLRQTADGNGIQTFDMNNGTSYTNALEVTSNSTNFANSATAVQAHWGAEKTHKYFLQKHNRNSFDNNGGIIKSYVSYSTNYVNAYWNGSVMTYGDGDGTNYGPLVSLDIVGHEITHGVTERSANLVYSNESGALNESFSDIFGESIEAFGQASNDWLMGEQIGAGGSGGALRSMSNPNAFGDPDTYQGTNWATGTADNGGVHTNSGVQNFWFYVLSIGKAGTNDSGNAYTVTGLGMDKAASIAYRNLTVYLGANSTYADARTGAIQAAVDLYGAGSAEEIATTNAWYAVGVGAEYVQTCALGAPVNLASSSVGNNGFTLTWNAVSGAASYAVTVGGTTATVNGTSYTTTGLNPGTAYTCSVAANCTAGGSGTASTTSVTTTGSAPVTYCASASTNTTDEYIQNVQLNTINNASGAQFYSDFTAISTSLDKGVQYTITVTPKWTATVWSEGYSVWIDYNHDGDFADAGEQVFSKAASKTTPVSGTFTVPAGATSGNTRMRVSMKYNAIPTACETFTYGEVEDYTVNIVSAVADTQAPTAPTSLTSTNLTQSSVDLSWTASTDNVGVTGYDVFKDGVLATSVTGTTATISGLTVNTTYSFTVKAKDAAGNVSGASNIVSVTTPDTQAPTVPSGLVSANITLTSVDLSWAASTDNVGVTSYDVFKDGVLMATITGTSYAVTGLTSNTTYAFTVKAKDAAGNVSGASNALNVTTLSPPDNQAPTAPTGLSASNITQSSVSLSWTASTDNVGVTGYDVFKDGALTTSVTSTTATISGLTASTVYAFTVKAKDAAGNISAVSNTVNATTLANNITYCTSTGTNVNYEYIDYVGIGGIANTTAANGGYGDFTAQVGNLPYGSNTIVLSVGFASTAYTENWNVWIDYNQNGTFETSELAVSGSTSNAGNLSYTFTVPTSALAGNTRMRVSMKWNGAATACQTFTYGEVEDYTVNIGVPFTGFSAVAIDGVLGNESALFKATTFPNPAKDYLNISLRDDRSSSYRIVNMFGQTIKQGDVNNNTINLHNLKTGLYFVEINDGQKVIRSKFIKE